MKLYARQGDLVIRKLETPYSGEMRAETNSVLAGSAGSEHTLSGLAMVARSGGSTFLRIATNTSLVHGSRHNPTDMVPGDYEVTILRERGNDADRQVED